MADIPNILDIFAGRTVQQVQTVDGSVATGATAIPIDDTIPQITEGVEFMTLAITPKNANNILVIEALLNVSHTFGVTFVTVALFQDAIANALAAGVHRSSNTSHSLQISVRHRMVAGGITPITFRVRAGSTVGATLTFNGQASARILGGVLASYITVKELIS